MELVTDCQRTHSVTQAWSVVLLDDADGSVIREIDIAAEGGTVGNSGVTFAKAALMYGLYASSLTAMMTGHEEFNDTTIVYLRIEGKLYILSP